MFRNKRRGPARRGRRNQVARLTQQLNSIKLSIKTTPYLVPPIMDPPQYKQTNVFSRTIRYISNATPETITPTTIMNTLIAASARNNFNIQFIKVRAWSTASSASVLQLSVINDTEGSAPDYRNFSDRGTPGMYRPSVHVAFGRDINENWYPNNGTQGIVIVNATPTASATEPVILDFHVNIQITPAVLTF